MIDGRPEHGIPVGAHKLGESLHIRPDKRIREQNVGAARRGDHLGLGNGGALVFVNAQRFRHPHDLCHLVGFDVRAQPPRPVGHRDHGLEVLTNQLGVDQERRTEEFRRVADQVTRIHHGSLTSKVRNPGEPFQVTLHRAARQEP